MKKRYICPETELLQVFTLTQLLGASQVGTGGTPGDEYTEGDVSYSRGDNTNVWDDDDDFED